MTNWHRRDVLGMAAGMLLPLNTANAFTGTAVAKTGEALQARIRGQVLLQTSPDYEMARTRVWSSAVPRRYPDIIVRVANISDVVEAIGFAKKNDLKVAIRGGGHNWVYPSIRDGGILLDLAGLDELSINAANKTAIVGPGVSGGAFVHHLSAFGLAFPVAHCPSVPLSGYLLNGGLGWNTGIWGPAASNILAVDVVTADGELLHATPTRHSDLFWAARGAGPGFFGAVVRFHLKVYKLPSVIQATTYVFPLESAAEISSWSDSVATNIPANVEFSFATAGAPPPYLNPARKLCVVSGITFANQQKEADAALEFMSRALPARPVMQAVGAKTNMNTLLEDVARLFPPHARYLGNCMWSNAPLADFFPAYARHLAAAPSHRSFANSVIYPAPGAGAVPLPDAAMSKYEREIVLWYAIWDDYATDRQNEDWFLEASRIFQAHASGFYIGETNLHYFPENARQSFGPENWEKLKKLRAKYDPQGRFFSFWGLDQNARGEPV